MKRNATWKMKFEELLPMLSLLNPSRRRIFELRFWRLADEGFVKLTLLDGDHIDEIEIPIQEPMEED